jgi:hypothetical protein
MSEIPLHIRRYVLAHLSYVDIMNYCHMHGMSEKIINDTDFWMQKLNNDFSGLQNVTQLKPADYVMRFCKKNEDFSTTYGRWEYFRDSTIDTLSLQDNIDIIMFHLDTGRYDMKSLNKLICKARMCGGAELLDKLLRTLDLISCTLNDTNVFISLDGEVSEFSDVGIV